MGQFDMLVEETKRLAREAAKATNPQLKQQFRKQDQPQVPAPRPELDSRAEYDAIVARRAREEPLPTPVVPAMEKFRAVEQAQQPAAAPPDFVPPDLNAGDPAVNQRLFQDFSAPFLARNPEIGSSAGLDEKDLGGLSNLYAAGRFVASQIEYVGKYSQSYMQEVSSARDSAFGRMADITDADIDEARRRYNAGERGISPESIAADRAKKDMEVYPVLNYKAAQQAVYDEVKEEQGGNTMAWLSAPENTPELIRRIAEKTLVPPERPSSLVEKAAGVIGKGLGSFDKMLLDYELFGETSDIFGLPHTGLSLGHGREMGQAGVEATALPDSVKRIFNSAINTGTDPLFLMTMAIWPAGSIAKTIRMGTEIALGGAAGEEIAPNVGLTKTQGQIIGALGAMSADAAIRMATGWLSPSALAGEAAVEKPFNTGSAVDLRKNLMKRPYSVVSPNIDELSWTPARQLEEANKLVKRAKTEGINGRVYPNAEVVDGAYYENGLKAEKSVFFPGMNATDAATLGAELRQKFVMVPEGRLNVSTGELNPIRGEPLVGNDLALGDGITQFKNGLAYSQPIDFETVVPYGGAAIPLEQPAAAGALETMYHGTSTGKVVPGKGGVWVARRPATAETIAKASGKLVGGTPETLKVSVPANMKIASEAETDAIRRGAGLAKGDSDGLANAVREQGYDAYDAGMDRIAIVNPDVIVPHDPNVVTLGDRRFKVYHPDSYEALKEGVGTNWLLRRVWRRIYQIGGRVPGLRRTIIPFNPQALLDEPMALDLAARNATVDIAAATNKMNWSRLVVQPRSGWLNRAITKDVSEVGLTAEGRANTSAWYVENGRTYATQNDILSFGGKYYTAPGEAAMSQIDLDYISLEHQMWDSYVAHLEAVTGTSLKKIAGMPEGWHWVPRGPQVGKRGVEFVENLFGRGGRVGGGSSFTKTRIYEYQAAFKANGGNIGADHFDVIMSTMNGMRRMEDDFYLTEIAEKYGKQISELVSPELKVDVKIAAAYRTWDERLVEHITKQMKDLSTKRTFRALRPIAGEPPDAFYSETAGKVQDIVDRYTVEAEAARAARAANPRVRNLNPPQSELNRIAAPYKVELKDLLDAAKARQPNAMKRYMAAKRELQADYDRLRSGVAGPEERVKPQVFPGHENFPEDSFAFAQVPPTQWPKLSGYVFPKDMLERLSKVMNDQGNTITAAIQKLNDFPRTFQAGADANYPFIQSLPLLFRDSAAWGKAVARSYGTAFGTDPAMGIKYMLSQADKYPEQFAAFLKWVRQMGDQEYFQSARQGGYLYKIPGIGHWYGRMAQGFDTMLDVGRWEYWKGIYAKAKTDGDFESLGAVTRDLLGTTSTRGLGVSMTQRQIEGGILMFAPRYTRSAFGLLAWAMEPGVAGGEARRALADFMAGGTILYTATCMALGQTPQLNPFEAGFMSVRVGDNWLGMGGIFRSMLRSFVWSIDTAINDPSKFYDPRQYLDNPVFEFFRSRSAPITTKLIDVISGKDFIGRPTRSDWPDIINTSRRMFMPFGIDTMLDAKGAMLPRMGAILGEFFLGRSTAVSSAQLRDEAAYRYARAQGLTVHDVNTGQERPPKTYRELTADQRIAFDQAEPSYTKNVQGNTKAMERAWAAMDKVSKDTEAQLASISQVYNDSNSPHYQDGTWYRAARGDVLQTARIQREAFFDANPAVERNPTTQEQKWVTSYNEEVIKASLDPSTGMTDWSLQEQLDRIWRRDNGLDAAAVVDNDYAASMDDTDRQFRLDRLALQPYYDFEDSAWSQDFLYGPDPVALPMLTNGQKPLNFRSSGEYRSALRADLYKEIQENGLGAFAGLPASQGGESLGNTFPGKLSDTQIRRVSNILSTLFMQPYYDKLDPVVTEYLKANPKFLAPLLAWDYKPGSIATDLYLP